MTLGPDEGRRLDQAVVLVARPAIDGLAQALDRQHAVVSFARAALERGLDIVTTADPAAVSLIAQAALPHTSSHAAERLRSTARVHVVETGGNDDFARVTVAPFMRRAAIAYLSREREPVDIAEESRDLTEPPGAFHPFAPWLSEVRPRTIGSVLVCPSSNDLDLAAEWPEAIRHSAFCADSDVAARAAEFDPSDRLLEELRLGADDFEPDDLLQGGRSHPYGVMSELLLDEWLHHDR